MYSTGKFAKGDQLTPAFVSDGGTLYYLDFRARLQGEREHKAQKMIEELTRDDPNQKS